MSINIVIKPRKVTNIVHRIYEYLENPNEQDQVLLKFSNRSKAEWESLAKYEQENQKTNVKNNEGREYIIPLPNDLKDKPQELKEIVHTFISQTIGDDHPYEYAIHTKHKGKEQENLHAHIVFSERKINLDLKIKTYAKDIWQDKTTHRLTKANAENSELVHKKGEEIYKNGVPVYVSEPYTTKDKKFKQRIYLKQTKEKLVDILNSYGYDFTLYDYNSPYLKQKSLYGYHNEKIIEETKTFNAYVKHYNKKTKELLEIKPNLEQTMIQKKKELFKENEKPLLDKIKHLTQLVVNTIRKAKEKLQEITQKEKPMTNTPTPSPFVQNSPRKPLNLQKEKEKANEFNAERILNDIDSVLKGYDNNNDIDTYVPDHSKDDIEPGL